MAPLNHRFTVIIPTKDRAQFLAHTLKTCAIQEYDNLEIVVSDDGSKDHTREVVEEARRRDGRIRYVSPGAGVGMLEHFEFALQQAKDGYVIALGGDDGLIPHGIRDMNAALNETGQELLAWPAPMYFYANTRMKMAQMVIHTRYGRPHTGLRTIDSDTFLKRQARDLAYVGDIESPMFYVKGVASTRLVEAVRRRSPGGRFYSCPTPDGYSGIVLAGEVKTYAFSGRPFSLHGVSPTSAGVGYLASSESAKRQSEAFFASVAHRPMHSELGSQPYSPLISLMTADYLLTARDLPGWPGARPSLDMRRVLRKSLVELQDGLFAQDRIARELTILHGIARHHGLEDYFRTAIQDTRRNARRPLEGNAFSPKRVYLNADDLGIENVLDAAYFAYYAHSASSAFTGPALLRAIANSVRYKTFSLRRGPAIADAGSADEQGGA
ncbi:MAG TPA: glycosyltransferase family A protein [Gemmatimonadaceae bacterium]|nr:glycosyltransferase family A protein [Gemmatimonadaceae bacterium]